MMREPGGLTMPDTYRVNSLSSRTPLQTQPTALNCPEHAKSPVVDEHSMEESHHVHTDRLLRDRLFVAIL